MCLVRISLSFIRSVFEQIELNNNWHRFYWFYAFQMNIMNIFNYIYCILWHTSIAVYYLACILFSQLFLQLWLLFIKLWMALNCIHIKGRIDNTNNNTDMKLNLPFFSIQFYCSILLFNFIQDDYSLWVVIVLPVQDWSLALYSRG